VGAAAAGRTPGEEADVDGAGGQEPVGGGRVWSTRGLVRGRDKGGGGAGVVALRAEAGGGQKRGMTASPRASRRGRPRCHGHERVVWGKEKEIRWKRDPHELML
jgi:hypothetical protein